MYVYCGSIFGIIFFLDVYFFLNSLVLIYLIILFNSFFEIYIFVMKSIKYIVSKNCISNLKINFKSYPIQHFYCEQLIIQLSNFQVDIAYNMNNLTNLFVYNLYKKIYTYHLFFILSSLYSSYSLPVSAI